MSETKLPFQADTLAAINRAAKQAKLAGIPIEVDWLIAATESGALQSKDSPLQEAMRCRIRTHDPASGCLPDNPCLIHGCTDADCKCHVPGETLQALRPITGLLWPDTLDRMTQRDDNDVRLLLAENKRLRDYIEGFGE